MPEPRIRIQGLSKIFGPNPKAMLQYLEQGLGKEALLQQHAHVLGLHDITMDFEGGQIEVVMGLSGSGKSTLLRHINRLVEPSCGSIRVDGEDVLAMNARQLRQFRQYKTAMVFQNFALLPHRNVFDNIAFGLKAQRRDGAFIQKQSMHWLERVGLKGIQHHYPAQLSGGMQQRVGLARALACDADILMMDEAFSALDPLIRSEMQELLLELQQELHKTIVFITHDLDEALKVGDRIAILKDGRLVQHATPQDLLLAPADDYVRRFVADVNRLPVLRARSIMQDEIAKDDSKALKVHADDCIDKILPLLLTNDVAGVTVIDNKGNRVGYIHREVLAKTLFDKHCKPAD